MKASRRVWVLAAVGLSGALATALHSVHSRSDAGAPAIVGGLVEPVLEIVGSGLGGTVAEVFGKQGDRVRAGDIVVRFDDSALRERLKELAAAERSAEGAMQGQQTVERIPGRLKRYLYETTPDVVGAEKGYVAALDAFDAAPAGERASARLRLAEATENRVAARRKLDRVLQHMGAQGELLALTAQLRKNRAEAEALLPQTEARATCDGVLDLLDLSKGDRVLPRSAVALVRCAAEYACDLTMRNAGRLHRGMRLRGTFAGEQPLLASVASITRRPLPAAFREKSEERDETVVRLRFHSPTAIAPGAPARFLIP
ncbi:MAG: biotin/lipoyl-binding protein [Acidobacteriota bacterium]|nr:biotin/lipoyl-binding protein [Acidobacteriota bacterium]